LTIVGEYTRSCTATSSTGRAEPLPKLLPELGYNATLPYLGRARAREDYERLRARA